MALNPSNSPQRVALDNAVYMVWQAVQLVVRKDCSGDHGGDFVERSTFDQSGKMLALSVPQPHAEAIIRGVRTTEYRLSATPIRGHIYIYASQQRYDAAQELALMRTYEITGVDCNDLPRGVIIGTVDLFYSDGGEWHLRNPERARRLRRPTNRPQSEWFEPF